jgi:hypothetical protein
VPLLQEIFRKNTSLVEVAIDRRDVFRSVRPIHAPAENSRPSNTLRLGIWSRALAKVATELDVLFHVLRNKPKLVWSAGGYKKRKCDDE